MPELLHTIKSMHKKEAEKRKFEAGLQGVDLNIEEEGTQELSFDDVERKALGINASANDVVSLQGSLAQRAGFGIGMGLGYDKE